MAVILVIDDDDMFRVLLCKLLESVGHETVGIENGEAGIATAIRRHPDLIVTDMNMPGMTGWELIRRLRREQTTASIPVVVVSGQESAPERGEGYEGGYEAYMNKTAAPEALMAGILAHLP